MRMTGSLFSKGKRVEVSLGKVENCEVWFPAVVEEETENDCFLVEYQCLGKNGVPESVRVKVDFIHIRPSPPQFVKNYDLLEKVDAYIDFGWWSGVITKELPDSKYLIFFKQTKKQTIVNQSEIRPHMEWKEGNWFSASQDLLMSPDRQGPAKNSHQTTMVVPGGLATLKENSAQRAANFFNSLDIRNEWLASSNIEPSRLMTSQRKKAKLLSPNTDEQTKMMKVANMADLPHLSTDHLNSSPVGTPSEEIHFGCTNLTGGGRTNNSEQIMGDQLLDKISRTTRRKRAKSKVKRYKPVESKSTPFSLRRSAAIPLKSTSETRALAGDKIVGELDNRAPEPSVKNNEMLPIAQLNGRKKSEDKTHDDDSCTKENFVEGECVTEVPVTRNLDSEVIEGSQSNKLPRTPPEEMVEPSGDREQQPHDPAVNGTEESDQLEGHKESIWKRKRGRRPRKLINNLEVSQENVEVAAKSPEVGQQNAGKKLAKSPEISQQSGGGVPADKTHDDDRCTKENFVEGECVTEVPVTLNLDSEVIEGSQSNKLPRTAPEEMVEPSGDREQQHHDPAVNGTEESDRLEGHKESIGKRKRGRQPRKLINNLEVSQENAEVMSKGPEVGQQNAGKKLAKSPEISQQSGGGVPADKTHDDDRCTKENFVEGECVTEVPVSCNLDSEVIQSSQSNKLPRTPPEEMVEPSGDREQQHHDPAVNWTEESDQLEGHKESIGKRKRGTRLRKLIKNLEVSQENVEKKVAKGPEVSQQNAGKKLAKSPEISQQSGGGVTANMALEVVLPVVVGLKAAQVHGSVSDKEKLGVDKKILNDSAQLKSKSITKIKVYPGEKDRLQRRKIVQASVEHHEENSSKREIRRSTRINAKSPHQDPKDTSVGKIAEANAEDSVVKDAETSSTFNLSDDQPLSMWMGSPKAANATCASRGMNMEPCTANRSPNDIVMLSPQSNDDSLPFVKRSSLWKSIESMEVFRQLPQRPNFQSLCCRKESSREGLAIALMVNFASVVEKTSTLQFDGPRSTIEDYLETLIELENNGFDVKVIRDRLFRLLLIKDKQEELQGNSKETTDQIKEKNQDKVKIDERFEEIDNQICLLQEERALVLSTKEEKDISIAALEVNLNEISSSIKNVSLEFEALVAAPWQGACS